MLPSDVLAPGAVARWALVATLGAVRIPLGAEEGWRVGVRWWGGGGELPWHGWRR